MIYIYEELNSTIATIVSIYVKGLILCLIYRMIVIRHPYAFFDAREASDRRYFAGQPAWPSVLPSSRHPLSKMRASTVAQPNNVAFPCIVNDTSRQTSTRSRQQIIYRSILLCGHFRGFQKIMPDNNGRAKWLSTIPGRANGNDVV